MDFSGLNHIIESTKKITQDELNFLLQNEDKLTPTFKIEDVKQYSKEFLAFSASLPQTGRLAYKFLSPENKEQLHSLVEKILKTQPLAAEYSRYLACVDTISDTYSASTNHKDMNRKIAAEDLKKRLGNQVLRACKKLLAEKELLSEYCPELSESPFNSEIPRFPEEVDPETHQDYVEAEAECDDPEQAYTLFQQSADQGNSYAVLRLAGFQADPSCEYFDPENALKLYQSVIKEFPEQANYKIAKLYSLADTALQNIPKAIEHFRIVANRFDNSHAQYALAKIFLDKNAPHYSFQEGLRWLTHSAEQKNPNAQARLGSMYLWGDKNIKQDIKLGKSLLKDAIENGNEYAQHILTMYENYEKDIAVNATFSLLRELLVSCSSQRQPDQLQSIVSKAHAKNRQQHKDNKVEEIDSQL